MWGICIFSHGSNLGRLVLEWGHWRLIVGHISAVVEQDSAALCLRIVLFCVVQIVGLVCLSIHSLVLVLGTLIQLLGHQSTLLS